MWFLAEFDDFCFTVCPYRTDIGQTIKAIALALVPFYLPFLCPLPWKAVGAGGRTRFQVYSDLLLPPQIIVWDLGQFSL